MGNKHHYTGYRIASKIIIAVRGKCRLIFCPERQRLHGKNRYYRMVIPLPMKILSERKDTSLVVSRKTHSLCSTKSVTLSFSCSTKGSLLDIHDWILSTAPLIFILSRYIFLYVFIVANPLK